jgi:predicted phosphodiesterase
METLTIHFISDLHCEHGDFCIPVVERDVLIIAGDYHYAMDGVDKIKEQCLHSDVILVLGNHDFYGYCIQEVIDFWEAQDIDNFHFLNNSNVFIKGVNFIGSTLFPCFMGGNPISQIVCQQEISDYKGYIYSNKNKTELFSPNEAYALSIKDAGYVKTALSESSHKTNVLVSHYLPTWQSVADKYKQRERDMLISGGFVSNIENTLSYLGPDLAIHGHTHESFDYMFSDKTRVLCNPRGYKSINMVNPNFDSTKTIKININ